ncbi:MAG: hypothetical protein M0Z66_11335 [Thermaerobacter sp.]|nr:hypothetical protein [Thermaerobacter sp.]
MSTLSEWASRERAARPGLTHSVDPNRPPLSEGLALAGITFALSLLLGLHMVLQLHIVPDDTIARVANAYYVLFSREPHLGAIGFVWNPLPSLLELPLTVLRPLWPPLVADGFAGNIVSAGFAALGALYMNRILARIGLGRLWRLLFSALYLLNPLILFYGANGMSDAMMVATFLAAWEGAIAYLQHRRLGSLAAAALWLAVAFLIRYEAVPFAFMLAGGMLLGLYWQRRPAPEIEGALTIFLTPIVYVGAWWVYMNWLIMKNPLYFMNSAYGNASSVGTGSYYYFGLAGVTHHLLAAFLYAAQFALLFWPVVPGAIGALLLMRRKGRSSLGPLLLLGTVAVAGLQMLMLYLGKSAGWDRFFITYVPGGFLLIAFLFSHVSVHRRAVAGIAAALVLLVGDVGTLVALQNPILGHGDSVYIASVLSSQPISSGNGQFRTIASYIDAHPRLVVLLDTFSLWGVVLASRNPKQFVITSDLNFQSLLHYPGGRVSSFLVPQPKGIAQLDAINRAYPKLWSGSVPWARLVHQFPGPSHVRLFRITPNAP